MLDYREVTYRKVTIALNNIHRRLLVYHGDAMQVLCMQTMNLCKL